MSRKKSTKAAKAEEDEAAEAEREAEREDRKAAAQERVSEARKAAAAAPPATKRSGYVVAEGKSIHCSARGIVGPGKAIEARDLCRDAESAKENFARHLEAGTIVKA